MITQNLLEVNKAAQLVAASNRASIPTMVGDENKQNSMQMGFEMGQNPLDFNLFM